MSGFLRDSLAKVLEKAKRLSGVEDRLVLHDLRHAYATHMIDAGVPLHLVQKLLGHSSIKTTSIHLHTSNQSNEELYNPLNNMNIG
jgi:site-specific recombinase XerD